DLMPGPGTLHMGTATPGILAAVLCVVNMIFAAKYLKESRDFTEQPQTGEVQHTSREAMLRVISHASEPSSRLIWIYAISMGAYRGAAVFWMVFRLARGFVAVLFLVRNSADNNSAGIRPGQVRAAQSRGQAGAGDAHGGQWNVSVCGVSESSIRRLHKNHIRR